MCSSDLGFALTHVRAAAVEAGISEEFVEAALADVRTERDLPGGGAGVEWDVRDCGSFDADPGRWQRLRPGVELPR